jgi:hypothetical protein
MRWSGHLLLVTCLVLGAWQLLTGGGYGVPALAAPAVPATAPERVRPAVLAVDAHDGHAMQVAGTYYRYGTAYGCGFRLVDPAAPWCGVAMYSSRDLVTWTHEGLAFEADAAWQERCVGGLFGCFRPKIEQRTDGRFVMWINSYDTQAGYWVLEGPSALGPWTVVRQPELALSLRPRFTHGDHDVTVAPDGTGYVAYTLIGDGGLHDLVVERLDSTLTTGTGEAVRLGLTDVESPSLFERAGTWYLTYSDPACPYCVTGTSYATAPSPLGPWTQRGRFSADSCGGQPAAVDVLTIDGEQTFLWQVDRWHDGAWEQATAPTYAAPLVFAPDGSIPEQECLEAW